MSELKIFDWERCTHEGIGMPGCSICDPDVTRVLKRNAHVDRLRIEVLETVVTLAMDALKHPCKQPDACDSACRCCQMRFRVLEAARQVIA